MLVTACSYTASWSAVLYELNYLSLSIDDNLTDLYDNCSSLNFKTFRVSGEFLQAH